MKRQPFPHPADVQAPTPVAFSRGCLALHASPRCPAPEQKEVLPLKATLMNLEDLLLGQDREGPVATQSGWELHPTVTVGESGGNRSCREGRAQPTGVWNVLECSVRSSTPFCVPGGLCPWELFPAHTRPRRLPEASVHL